VSRGILKHHAHSKKKIPPAYGAGVVTVLQRNCREDALGTLVAAATQQALRCSLMPAKQTLADKGQ
jgi:hypothetical protein